MQEATALDKSIRGQPFGRADRAFGGGGRRRDAAPAGLRRRSAARAVSQLQRARAGSHDRQHRRRHCRRRPARSRYRRGRRRDARRHHRGGGEGLSRAWAADAEIAIKLAVGAGARLSWLPQETILFDRARLKRRIEVELAADATLVMAEAVVFGRAAMGEAVEQGAFTDRWRVRRDGRLVFAETVRLDGAIARMLAEPAWPAVASPSPPCSPCRAMQAMVERARAQTFCGEVGISAWNGLAVARLCAKDGASLRRDLATVITALGGTLPRLWLELKGRVHEFDAAREGQAADRHGGDRGAAAARARRQAQPSRKRWR